MADLCSDTINPLYNNYFQFKINRGRGNKNTGTTSRQLRLLVQRINLPGLSIRDSKQPTIFGTTIPVPTLGIDFEPLSLEFIVDANLANWLGLYSWLRNISNIDDADSNNIAGSNNGYQNWHGSASLIIPSPIVNSSTNSKEITKLNPLSINFENLIPEKLSGMVFQVDVNEPVVLKASCTFRYSYYTIDASHNPPTDLTASGQTGYYR